MGIPLQTCFFVFFYQVQVLKLPRRMLNTARKPQRVTPNGIAG